METPNVDELKKWVKENPQVWDLYAKGLTLGLNQCERMASTQKVMRLKPQNVVELAAFVAAIRPGAKSIAGDFFDRRFHNYGIPAMDEMLKLEGASGITGQSSFIFYDEQILHLAQAAGIEPGDAVTLIKSIKKKKKDKVLAYHDRFVPGFKNYLITKENDNDEHAQEISEQVWKVIQDSAAYLFNASHALAMAYDSLYGAMLKTIAPYEFYKTLLRLYTKKKQKAKVSFAVTEMKKSGITMTTGRFGQDNRDWYIDKENHTISQAISSIKNISARAAEDLYNIKDKTFDTFTDMLRELQMNTSLDTRQVRQLILLNYFEQFGKTQKLIDVYNYYYELLKNKNLKSAEERLEKIRIFEKTLEDKEIYVGERAKAEFELTGIVFSSDPKIERTYLVSDAESKYSCHVKLINLQTGNRSEEIMIRKADWAEEPLKDGDIITIPKTGYIQRDKVKFVDGQRIKTGDKQWWIQGYKKIM